MMMMIPINPVQMSLTQSFPLRAQPLNPKLPNYSNSSDPLTLKLLMMILLIMMMTIIMALMMMTMTMMPSGPPVCPIRWAVPVPKRVPRTVEQIQRERENYQEAYCHRRQHRGGEIEMIKGIGIGTSDLKLLSIIKSNQIDPSLVSVCFLEAKMIQI